MGKQWRSTVPSSRPVDKAQVPANSSCFWGTWGFAYHQAHRKAETRSQEMLSKSDWFCGGNLYRLNPGQGTQLRCQRDCASARENRLGEKPMAGLWQTPLLLQLHLVGTRESLRSLPTQTILQWFCSDRWEGREKLECYSRLKRGWQLCRSKHWLLLVLVWIIIIKQDSHWLQ